MLDALLQLDGNLVLWAQEVLRSDFLNPFFILYTHLGDVGAIWIVLSLLMLCHKKTRICGVAGLLALLIGALCTNVTLKHLVARTRPWLVVEGLVPLVTESDPLSFPSGHTCAAFASTSAWARHLPKKWMAVLGLSCATLMAFSRLYVGVHYLSDIIVGCLVGLFSGWLACQLVRRLQKTH